MQWCAASEVYIPKTKPPNLSNVKDFRLVPLLNIKGKIIISLVSRKFKHHIITKNKIINSSAQNGGMTNVLGCWVHMSVVWDKSKSSKVDKANITALWLVIANAYGSAPQYLNVFLL